MTVFEWDGWVFEPTEWRLTSVAVGVVPLPNKTLELLALLLDRAPRLVSKDEILATVWRASVVEEGNIAFHIAMLRKALGQAWDKSCVETVRGRGYRFVAPVTRRARAPVQPAVVDQPVPDDATPAPASAPAPAFAEPPAPVSGDIPALRARHHRGAARLWPAALLAIAVSLVSWASIASLERGLREVVVLPARDTEHVVVDGVANTIAAQLARQTTLASRTASWGDAGESAVEAGRRLKADSVLTATIDRSGDPWRIAVQLTRTRDGRRLWSWVFDVSSSAPAAATAIGVRAAAGLGRHLDAIVPSPVPDK
jgi:DNA-binding winged helix-turn-helix (wHTH) protein